MRRYLGKPELAAELAEALKEAGIVINIRGLNKNSNFCEGVAVLIEGGIKAVELPYTTIMSVGHPALREKGLLVGIGTVTYSTHAREAGTFGADFVTASVTTPDVVLRVSR